MEGGNVFDEGNFYVLGENEGNFYVGGIKICIVRGLIVVVFKRGM